MSATLFGLMVPETWRKIITEIAQPLPTLAKYLPVERYLAKEVKYWYEKSVADTPLPIKLGGGFPISIGTYEYETVDLDCYGYGMEIPKVDVDLVEAGMNVNVLRREIENKTKGMLRYQDKTVICTPLEIAATASGNTVSAAAAKWTTSGNAQTDVSEVIRLIEEDNYYPDTMVISPRAHECLLNDLTGSALTQAPLGVVRDGRVMEFLGLDVDVSNNLQTATTALIFQKNQFGVLLEAYPLTTIPPKMPDDNPFVYRAYWYAMAGLMVDRPNATGTVTGVY